MSSPPPLESRMEIEAFGRDQASESLTAPVVPLPPLPAPRSGEKRRGSPSAMEGTAAAALPPPKKHKQVTERECIQVDSDDDFLATPPTKRTPTKSKQEAGRAATVEPVTAARNSPKWTSTHAPRIKKKHAQKCFV
jgi:hypothetical protein